MFRVLTAFFLLIIVSGNLRSQQRDPGPRFKNGSIPAAQGMLHQKLTQKSWQEARFFSDYFLVMQFDKILDASDKITLAHQGISVQKWISGRNYLAVCHEGFNLKPAGPSIKNIFHIPPVLKFDSGTNARLGNQGAKDLIAVYCYGYSGTQIEEAFKNAGAVIVETKIKPANTWFLKAPLSVIEKIALLPFVQSLSPIHLEDFTLNYNNRAIHGVQAISAPMGRNLSGKNLTIGIGDNANPSGHVDLLGKLIMRTDEPIDYHGTHTSGIIAGGGIANPMYAGMAPRAHLVINDFSNILVNSPTYVADYQMPITNNSYYNGTAGCAGEGEYDVLSNFADSQMLVFPKLLHVFAAGNDGGYTCTPFPASFGTIKTGFQTGKNVLSVGSISTDVYQIGPNSSRGPTHDGRIKPEIVAGGVYVVSTIPYNLYDAYTGTSMASPTVAGILTLITERYRQLHGGDNPDAALLKTLAMNAATDMGNPGPDYSFGFGRINARETVEALEQNRYYTGTVTHNGNQLIALPTLPSGGYQLKVMLYWADAAALPMTPSSLVNDLDLTVTDPNAVTHLPMTLNPNPGNVNDYATEGENHRDNVEQVLINNPAGGNYILNIKGYNVPSGTQKFYVSYELIQPSVSLDYPAGNETWVPGQTETIRWTAYGGDPNPFTLEFSTDNGGSWTTINNNIPSGTSSYAFTVPAVVTEKALMRVSRNNTSYSGSGLYPFTIMDQPILTVTNTCPGYAQLTWNKITGADYYEVLKLSGDSLQKIRQTTDTSILITSLQKNIEHWFSVRPVHAGSFGRRSAGQPITPSAGACSAPGINNDLTIDALTAPVTGRMFTSSGPGVQRISVTVRNAGNMATTNPVYFNYQVNGGPVVTETYPSVIAAHGTLPFQFAAANSYDFSAPGSYQIKVWLQSVADTIPSNDTLYATIKNLRNDALILSPSFTEGFETASPQTWNQKRQGLDSLDRADFSNSGSNGRINSFFNSGFARTGNRSMLLDVTEQGTNAADSLTLTFNLSNYSTTDQIWLDLYYKRQADPNGSPANKIWIRGNDLAKWIPVKNLDDALDPTGKYVKVNLDVTGLLAAAVPAQTISSSFQVRCGAEGKLPAASSDPIGLAGGGISFDDFTITKSANDVGMRSLVQPGLKNICGLSNKESVSVTVRNFGTDTLKNIPVTYAINQDTVTEMIPLLGPKDSLLYNFTTTADMSVYQTYVIKAWVSNPTDNYHNNDSSSDYTIQTTPLVNSYPYLEGFETNNGYWFTRGTNSSWQWGAPKKKIIHEAANGNNAWVTSLTGNYNDNEYSFLYSPCFDLTTLTQPVLSFSHIFRTEDDCNCDYHWVEYSLDDSSWTKLGNATTGVNWYDLASTKAWQHSAPDWRVSSYDIPVITNKIRFRIVMYSDPGSNYEGVGIDDVHVFDKAPVADTAKAELEMPVSGSAWIHYDLHGKRLFSINPMGQNLGLTTLTMYTYPGPVRDSAGQYYGNRNWVVKTENPITSVVPVRYYFTDVDAARLINATGCDSCTTTANAYKSGISSYSSENVNEEDSTLTNNVEGKYIFSDPDYPATVIPYDNGYYAETTLGQSSESWIHAGGHQKDHPLAAWLKDFTAVRMNEQALLNWNTWQEPNPKTFHVEKSHDSTVFIKLADLPAHAHLDSVYNYTYTDPQLWEGDNFYRIVLETETGDSLSSAVKKLFYHKDSVIQIPDTIIQVPDTILFRVYPNPTFGNIIIQTTSSCREIQIFDVLGRKLLERQTEGLIQHESLAAFPKGIYFLKLFTANGNKLIKLEKR